MKLSKSFITRAVMASMIFTSVASAHSINNNTYIAIDKNEEQIQCLARNIYFETRAVTLSAAMSVTDVVLNRVDSSQYPNTPCKVVHQGLKDDNGNMLRNKCQFSWYCDGKSDKPKDKSAWKRSLKFASDMYNFNYYRGLTEGSTHYHATYVQPFWAPSLDRVDQIGPHIFYRHK